MREQKLIPGNVINCIIKSLHGVMAQAPLLCCEDAVSHAALLNHPFKARQLNIDPDLCTSVRELAMAMARDVPARSSEIFVTR